MSGDNHEDELYKVDSGTYLTNDLARFLKQRGIDPKRFYSKKIVPYMTALKNGKYVFEAHESTARVVLLAVFAKDVIEDGDDIVVSETTNFDAWLDRVERTVADAGRYIM